MPKKFWKVNSKIQFCMIMPDVGIGLPEVKVRIIWCLCYCLDTPGGGLDVPGMDSIVFTSFRY